MDHNNKYSVLCVDDERINLDLFEITFRRNFNIILADSGPKALEILKQNRDVQIVISDLKMPNMSGIEFIKQANQLSSNIKFFLLSGYSLSAEINNYIQNGLVKKYFMKPMNKADIIDSVNQFINQP